MLSKYGPKETNPFFIHPVNNDKQTSDFKQFIIDMGVYTKGRDFRLLGSYKRTSTDKRYLWLEGAPNRLGINDFFDTLIQFQPKPSQIRYYIAHVIDTINGGIPQSSSLRTIAPLNQASSQSHPPYDFEQHSGNTITRCLSASKRAKAMVDLSPHIMSMIMNIIQRKFKQPLTTYKFKGSTILISSTSHQCDIKSTVTKTPKATHAKNCIYYMVIGTKALLLQSCFNNSYCYDFSKNRHRTEKLGVFRDQTIVDALRKWCADNGWEYEGDLDFIIPDKWMGKD